MSLQIQGFNLDLQNKTSQIFILELPAPGVSGMVQSLNINIRIEGSDQSTGAELKDSARLKAKELLLKAVEKLDEPF
jgi:hypothetical protein